MTEKFRVHTSNDLEKFQIHPSNDLTKFQIHTSNDLEKFQIYTSNDLEKLTVQTCTNLMKLPVYGIKRQRNSQSIHVETSEKFLIYTIQVSTKKKFQYTSKWLKKDE